MVLFHSGAIDPRIYFPLQELDDALARCSALTHERDQVAADCTTARQQLEARAKHCMALLEDNSRLRELTDSLKQQLAAAQIRQWQANIHQPAAVSKTPRNSSNSSSNHSSSSSRCGRTSKISLNRVRLRDGPDNSPGSMLVSFRL
jgi:hypothetical protein